MTVIIAICSFPSFSIVLQIITRKNISVVKSFPKHFIKTLKYSNISKLLILKSFPKRKTFKILRLIFCCY